MKQIINSLLYDTDTAVQLAATRYSTHSNLKHWSETLFRTKNGRFFGAFFDPGKNDYFNITPLTEAEALSWCETNRIDTDLTVAIFGDSVTEA